MESVYIFKNGGLVFEHPLRGRAENSKYLDEISLYSLIVNVLVGINWILQSLIQCSLDEVAVHHG